MDAGEAGDQLAAEILDAIRSGCDLYVFDHYLAGLDCLERARRLLIQRRDACSDPDETALLTSIICALEKNDSS
jgi:hypothetical protein